MKAFLLLVAFFGIAVAQDNYQLVWADEFNGNSLDLTKWQYEVNCDGGGNNELQCYTRNPQNLRVADGKLVITAIPQDLNGKKYTSARINTRHAAAWKYGRFEASAKIPNGQYLWPALWMMPRDSVYGGWAASGEIDIYEGRGQNLREYQSTLHYGGSWPNNVYRGSGERQHKDDLSAGFHTYSCTWTPQQISFAVDGVTFYTRSLSDNFYSGRGANPYGGRTGAPFDQPFYYIINMAIGGGFFGGNANALTTDMARRWANPTFEIDWVRVYQINGNPINPNPIPVPSSVQVKTTGNGGQASQSTGISVAKSSAASSARTTAESTAASSAESSAGTTFWYSAPKATSQQPQPTSNGGNNGGNDGNNGGNNNPNACPGGCGSGSCCADSRLGGVCYNTNTHSCLNDSEGNHLCGKGAGWCKQSGCYDAKNYKCVNGNLAPL